MDERMKKGLGICIYCKRSEKLSNEHYLPRCLGKFRGFEGLNDRVCKNCNEGFSAIDEQFCRSGPEAIVRSLLGIGGRPAHRKISPFQRGSAGAERLSFLARPLLHSDDVREIEMDVDQTGSLRRLRQIVLDFGSRQVSIRITDDMKEPEHLLERLKEKGVEFVEPREGEVPITAIITGALPSEIDWMQHLLSGLGRNMVSEPEISIEDKKEEATAVISASPTVNYFRALAKIGFHYFLKHVPGFHGSESTFAPIRDFISGGVPADVDSFIAGRREQISTDINWGDSATGYRHVLVARTNYHELTAKMQFFIPERYRIPLLRPQVHVLPIYTIMLGRNPSRLDVPRAFSHSFTYTNELDGYDGVLHAENIH